MFSSSPLTTEQRCQNSSINHQDDQLFHHFINSTNSTLTLSQNDGSNVFSENYCSIGNLGCSLIIIGNILPILFIFWVVYKRYKQWKTDFRQNYKRFYSCDRIEIRNVLRYGLKIWLNSICGVEALVQSILVCIYNYSGYQILVQMYVINFFTSIAVSIFIYLDAIAFHSTRQTTLILTVINLFSNILFFSVLIATRTTENVQILSTLFYIIFSFASSILILVYPSDIINIQTDSQYNELFKNYSFIFAQDQNNYLSESTVEQNLLQQHTTLDYGQGQQQNSNIYQPLSFTHLPKYKQSQIEGETSVRTSKSNQYKQNQAFTKASTNQNNQTLNNPPIILDGCNLNGTSQVKRSLSNNKILSVIPITPEDSFSSINYNQQSGGEEDENETADKNSSKRPSKSKNSSYSQNKKQPNKNIEQGMENNNTNINNNNYNNNVQNKMNDQFSQYQIQRMNLNSRSKSSIQCLGRQDFNTFSYDMDVNDHKKIDQQISGFFLGDQWSGSVDINDKGDQYNNTIKKELDSQIKKNIDGHIKMGALNFQGELGESKLSYQRQPTGLTVDGINLHSSVEYMGCSNQFVTPSFTQNNPHIESSYNFTSSSSNRDSLQLSQQITTPQFNNLSQSIYHNSPQKKPHSSIFAHMNESIEEEKISKKQQIQTSLIKTEQILQQQQQQFQKNSWNGSLESNVLGTNTLHSNDISSSSSYKQDSYQTSDSYLMNGGGGQNQTTSQQHSISQHLSQRNLNNQKSNNSNLHRIPQSALSEISQKISHNLNNNFQHSNTMMSISNQNNVKEQQPIKSKTLVSNNTSPQMNSMKNSPSSIQPQDKQQVINQMNDLFIKNKSTCSTPNSQQQSPLNNQITQQPILQTNKSSKNQQYEEDKIPKPSLIQQNIMPTDQQINKSAISIDTSKKKSDSSIIQKEADQQKLKKSFDPNEDKIGYYQERYSELKVFSFKQSEKFEKRTVVFNISYFDSKGEKIIIQRSYREFNDLHKYLSFKFRDIRFSLFPKKQNKLQLSSQELMDRTNLFNSYMQSVIQQIKSEIPVINHFLSQNTTCFSSSSVIDKHSPEGVLIQAHSNSNNSSSKKQPFRKLNSLNSNKPRSVPETIMEDSNDCSNVLTDSNASQKDDDYSTMSCNYQPASRQNRTPTRNANNNQSRGYYQKPVSPLNSRRPAGKY